MAGRVDASSVSGDGCPGTRLEALGGRHGCHYRGSGRALVVPEPSARTSRSLTLTTGGITLLGVLLSIGVTVAFGVKQDWWIRVLAGLGTTLMLGVVVKLGTSSGRGPLARLANWMIGGPDERPRRG